VSSLSASLIQILDQSSNEIYIFDDETYKFLYANKGAISNLGYSMEELIHMTPPRYKPPVLNRALSRLYFHYKK
jgi:PAS domain-containing protein